MKKKKSLIALVQDAIRKGAATAEDVHRSIADMPLKRLEKIKQLRGPLKKISKVQDESIGAIYNLIRDINEQVGRFATDMLAQAREAGIGQPEAAVHKRVVAAKRSARAAATSLEKAVGPKKRAAKVSVVEKKPAKAAASGQPVTGVAAKKRAVRKAAPVISAELVVPGNPEPIEVAELSDSARTDQA